MFKLNQPTLIQFPNAWFSMQMHCYSVDGDENILNGSTNRPATVTAPVALFNCIGYTSLHKEVFKFKIRVTQETSKTAWGVQSNTTVNLICGTDEIHLDRYYSSFHAINSSKSSFCIGKRHAAYKFFQSDTPIAEITAFANTLPEQSTTINVIRLLNDIIVKRNTLSEVVQKFSTTAKISFSPKHTSKLVPFTKDRWIDLTSKLALAKILNRHSVYSNLVNTVEDKTLFTDVGPEKLGKAMIESLAIASLYHTKELNSLITNLHTMSLFKQYECVYNFFSPLLLADFLSEADCTQVEFTALGSFFDSMNLDFVDDKITLTTTTPTESITDTVNLGTLFLTYYISCFGKRMSNLTVFPNLRRGAEWIIENLKADPSVALDLHLKHFGIKFSPHDVDKSTSYSPVSLSEALFYIYLGAKIPESLLDFASRCNKADSLHQTIGAVSKIEQIVGTSS